MSPEDPYPPYPGELPQGGGGTQRPRTGPQPAAPGSPAPAAWPQPPAPAERPEGPVPPRPGTTTSALWVMAAGALAYVALQAYTASRVGVLREDLESQMRPASGAPPALGDRLLDAMMIGIVAMGAFFLVVVLGLWIWMIVVNARGLRWARITATCLAAYNALSTLFTVGLWAVTVSVSGGASGETGAMAAQDTTSAALGALQALIGLVAVGLLWLGPSSAYIRAVGARRAWDRWESAHRPA